MKIASLAVATLLLAACSSAPQKPPAAAVSDLAPSGKLRAAINVGNAVLAARPTGSQTGPTGISVDLAHELGRRLGVPVELVVFDAAGKVVEAGRAGAWDIAFVALDPARAAEINQSPPYVQIEGAYLVRNDSRLANNEQVDGKGNRVVVGRNSAYDLYLTRELKQAQIVRVPTSATVVDTMLRDNLEVAAGVKQALENDAKRLNDPKKAPTVRLLPGRFMVINQAMASQRIEGTRGVAGARYLRAFIEEMKASGFVAKAIERHQQPSAIVAPPGDPR
jgi:polar amino acid transport system substrate-binding protein